MEDRLFELVLEGDGAPDDVVRPGPDLDIADGELGRVQDDLIDRFVHGDVDRHGPRKGGRTDVRLNLNPVDVWLHRPG